MMISFPTEEYTDDVVITVTIGELVNVLNAHGFTVVNYGSVRLDKKVEIEGSADLTPPDLDVPLDDLIGIVSDEGYGVLDEREIARLAEAIAKQDIEGCLDVLSHNFRQLESALRTRLSLLEKFNV